MPVSRLVTARRHGTRVDGHHGPNYRHTPLLRTLLPYCAIRCKSYMYICMCVAVSGGGGQSGSEARMVPTPKLTRAQGTLQSCRVFPRMATCPRYRQPLTGCMLATCYFTMKNRITSHLLAMTSPKRTGWPKHPSCKVQHEDSVGRRCCRLSASRCLKRSEHHPAAMHHPVCPEVDGRKMRDTGSIPHPLCALPALQPKHKLPFPPPLPPTPRTVRQLPGTDADGATCLHASNALIATQCVKGIGCGAHTTCPTRVLPRTHTCRAMSPRCSPTTRFPPPPAPTARTVRHRTAAAWYQPVPIACQRRAAQSYGPAPHAIPPAVSPPISPPLRSPPTISIPHPCPRLRHP